MEEKGTLKNKLQVSELLQYIDSFEKGQFLKIPLAIVTLRINHCLNCWMWFFFVFLEVREYDCAVVAGGQQVVGAGREPYTAHLIGMHLIIGIWISNDFNFFSVILNKKLQSLNVPT